jgi:hypothetical protein
VLEVAACGCAADGDAGVTRDPGVAEALADLERPVGALEARVDVAVVDEPKSLRVEDVRVLALVGTLGGEL